jgi:hypothetical protein
MGKSGGSRRATGRDRLNFVHGKHKFLEIPAQAGTIPNPGNFMERQNGGDPPAHPGKRGTLQGHLPPGDRYDLRI